MQTEKILSLVMQELLRAEEIHPKVLLKRMHESKEIFKQIMDTLLENGTVVSEFQPTAGKTVRVYRLV